MDMIRAGLLAEMAEIVRSRYEKNGDKFTAEAFLAFLQQVTPEEAWVAVCGIETED